MTDNKSRFRKSSRDVDDEFLLPPRPRKLGHRGFTSERRRTEARDDQCSLSSSVEESVSGKDSVSYDGSANEVMKADDEEIFVPVIRLVDSFNKWIFNENDADNHSCSSSVNDGSCTSNDEDSCESGSCASSQGPPSVSSSCCSSVDTSSVGWSQSSSVRHAHKYLSTIRNGSDDSKQRRLTEHLDEASLLTSGTGSTWGIDALAKESLRPTKNAVDFDSPRLESSALGSYITDDEENGDTLWADVESLHLHDDTNESGCVGNETAAAIQNILKDVRESSCLAPKLEDDSRHERDDEASSDLSVPRPKSKVLAPSVPESIIAKSPKRRETKPLNDSKGQELETRRLANFSTPRSGRPGPVQSVTPLAFNRTNHVGGRHAPSERVTVHHNVSKINRDQNTAVEIFSMNNQGQHNQGRESPASANRQDSLSNKDELSNANDDIELNIPASIHATEKHSKAKQLVASLRRARLAWKDRIPKRMGVASISRKIKHRLGNDNHKKIQLETSSLHLDDTNTRDKGVGNLDSDEELVTANESFEYKRKNYSCLGDRFMYLISGCAPTKLEQVQHAPSNVTEFGRLPILSVNSYDDAVADKSTPVVETTIVVNPNAVPLGSDRAATDPPGSKKPKLVATLARRLQKVPTRWGNRARGENGPEEAKNNNNQDTRQQVNLEAVAPTSIGVDSNHQRNVEQGESLQQLDGYDMDYSDGCIEKSLEDYQTDIAPRWATFTKYPWNGLVVFARKPSGVLSSEGPVEVDGGAVIPTQPTPSQGDIEMGFGPGGEWPMCEASNSDLELPQGIEAVIHTKSWKHLERLHNVQIIDGDESPTAKDPKGSPIQSLKRLSKRVLIECPKPTAFATMSFPRNNMVEHWRTYVAVHGQPQVLMIQSCNYGTRDLSTSSRLCMTNARCQLQGLM